MALIVKDRVRETTITIGTGTLTLLGAVPGFNSFSEIGTGNTTYYTIVDVATGSWEVGIGAYTTSSGELSRDTVLDSSSGGAKVSFSAGSKEVFITYPADRSVSQADIGTAPNEIPLNQYLGSMAYQNLDSVVIDGGVATFESATLGSIQNTTEISNVEPSLMLNFAKVKALDPRITFARASTGAYYDGKTVSKAEENLFTFSEQFDNAAWAKSNVTVTPNTTTAPDGTITADSVTPSATTSGKWIGQNQAVISGQVYSYTFNVKPNGYDFFQVWATTGFGTTDYINFNVATGVVGNKLGTWDETITSIGDGWFRITVKRTASSSGTGGAVFTVLNADTASRNPVVTGDGVSGLFLWGFQVEQRSAVSSYTPTTTQPITKYQPTLLTASANVARFDHDPITNDSLGLLVEEQRTNLLLRSEEFDNAYWTKTNVTITANQVIAPDGTLTMDKLISNSGSIGQIRRAVSLGVVTVSIFAKAGEFEGIRFGALGNGGIVSFNLSTGLVTSTSGTTSSASMVNVGNGVYRCVATWNQTANNTLFFDHFGFGTGDGYSGIYIWGAQLEAGAFPTSYIKTEASQVTRSADSASMTGANFSSWYRADEGSVILHYVENGNDTSSSGVNFNDGSTANRIGFFIDGSGATPIQPTFVVVSGNSVQANIVGSAPPINTVVKTATAYDNNSFILSTNGAVIGSDVAGVVPKVTQMQIGNQLNSSFANRSIKKIAYFPARLSDAELQEMTEQ